MQNVEIPIPQPKKNEVLVKVEASSINTADWKIQKGMLRPFVPFKFPFTPGKHKPCKSKAALLLVTEITIFLCQFCFPENPNKLTSYLFLQQLLISQVK
jgi:hypothetical protein